MAWEPNVHLLKINPVYFDAVKDNQKTFEVRNTIDRTFEAGDILVLREWDKNKYFQAPNDQARDMCNIEAAYTGRVLVRVVSYVLPGVEFNGGPAVVLGLKYARWSND